MKITANMVTILRIVLMPIPGYLLYGNETSLLAALFCIIVLGLTDLLDGIMARREGTTVLGGLLDPIADKIFIAVIYLPLTDRGIIPAWITAAIFARDFAVTALRTGLSLRNAPMRTAVLAKYKTAIQMTGIGYVVLFMAHQSDPNAFLVWFAVTIPIVMSISLILYRLVKRKKHGLRSFTLLGLSVFCVLTRVYLGPDLASKIIVYCIGLLTIVSGFSYFLDAFSAVKTNPWKLNEIYSFLIEGILLPSLFVFLLYQYHSPFVSAAVIAIVTLELATGGLGNLLADRNRSIDFRIVFIKTALQLLAISVSIAASFSFASRTIGIAAMGVALATSAAYGIFAFYKHRNSYLSAI